ncbi:CD276 antigen-like protein [Huso huso]|uniref:CD276 antigen-like protein n=1 Tax=Huso huso TaxID=61971 RepID=A0ABR0YCX1_HUSHU
MALSTEQALALLLILNSAHLTADCPPLDRVAVSGTAGGRAVLPCSYTPTPGQDVEVRWYAYSDQGDHILLIDSNTPSAPIPVQWSGRVKLSDEVSSGNASLLISELRLEDTLEYTCTVWINGICVTYRNVKLTVQGKHNKHDLQRDSTTATTQKTSPCPTQQGNAAAQRRSYCMKPL